MKFLSVSTPWPTAIARFGKRVENRGRWARLPGRLTQARKLVGHDLVVQSSQTHDHDGVAYLKRLTGRTFQKTDVVQGAVTLVVRVTGLLMPGDPCPPGQEAWYFGSVALVLDNVRVLPKPVPLKGSLSIQDLPADVERQVLEQLAGAA